VFFHVLNHAVTSISIILQTLLEVLSVSYVAAILSMPQQRYRVREWRTRNYHCNAAPGCDRGSDMRVRSLSLIGIVRCRGGKVGMAPEVAVGGFPARILCTVIPPLGRDGASAPFGPQFPHLTTVSCAPVCAVGALTKTRESDRSDRDTTATENDITRLLSRTKFSPFAQRLAHESSQRLLAVL